MTVRTAAQINPMFVVGTRPEAIKMAPVLLEARRHGAMRPVLVSTGQHRELLHQALNAFGLKPDVDMKIMAPHQTLRLIQEKTLRGFDKLLSLEKPDIVVVQGDTTSAFAAALAAFYHKIPAAHIEAGLRTYDRLSPYPEEMNRSLIADLACLHFAPTQNAANNLLSEGILRKYITVTGNTVIDALHYALKQPFSLDNIWDAIPSDNKLVLVTAHRRESFGKPLADICQAVLYLVDHFRGRVTVVFPLHKNPLARKTAVRALEGKNNILLLEPVDYVPFVHLMKRSYLILTDSGGIQEEASFLGKPVLVLRDKTERQEAVLANSSKLVGTDPANIFYQAHMLLTHPEDYEVMSQERALFGDGHASERIINVLLKHFDLSHGRIAEFDDGAQEKK